MKKLYSIFFIAFLLPIFSFAADYCTPGYQYQGKLISSGSYSGRYLRSITISDGTSTATLENITNQYSTNLNDWYDLTDDIVKSKGDANQMFIHPTYNDMSDIVLSTTAGSTINLTVNGADHWICQYLYIDFDNNGTFDVDATKAEANGDLVAHTGYNPSGADPTTDSDGNTVNYPWSGRESILPLPSYTLPKNITPGTYRARYKMDWNNVDACHTDAYYNYIVSCDFTIEILPYTVSVQTANEQHGSATIQNNNEQSITINNADAAIVVATPAEGYSFLNWTNSNGEVVSTDATYTYPYCIDETLTANFGFAITTESSEGGILTVTDNENNIIENGTVVAPGTELTLTANATGDYQLISLTVNNEAVENGATVEANSALSIKAEFSDTPYSVTINTNEGGYVKVSSDMDENENPAGTIYENGAALSAEATPYIYIVPDENYEINTITITGDNDTPFEYSKGDVLDDYYNVYVPESNPDAIIFFTSLLTGDLNISVQFAAKAAAIEGIDADNANAPVEYFNLQGMRVNADNLTSGIYVTRQGSKTVKVLVK